MQNPFQHSTDAQSAINDPLSFIKKLWGDMQLPGMVTPTISVDELDKQIKDLKTVESWLTVNMNMLRATIQALEVQRATITALKAMGESFAQSTASNHHQAPASASSNNAQWPMHQHTTGVSEAQADAENDEDDEDEDEDELTESQLPEEAAEKSEPQPQQESPRQTTPSEQPASESASASAPAFSNPAAWWTVLQDQFKQALGNALKDEPEAAVKARAKKSAVKETTSTRSPSVSSAAKKPKAGVKQSPQPVKVKATAVKSVKKPNTVVKRKVVAKSPASQAPVKSTAKKTNGVRGN